MHILVRSAFGIGEAGNFPASIKTVAEWFPKRERALATAHFQQRLQCRRDDRRAVSCPWCMIYFGDQRGWKMAFIITGAIGFLWLIFWFWLYDPPTQQKRLSKAEYDYIHIDDETPVDAQTGDKAQKSFLAATVSLPAIVGVLCRQIHDGRHLVVLPVLAAGLSDKQFGMTNSRSCCRPLSCYGVAIVGSIYGGSIPMTLIKRGMPVYKARMTTMFMIALCPLAVLLTQYFGNVEHFGKHGRRFSPWP